MSITFVATTNQQDDIRPLAAHPPNIWKDSHVFTSNYHPDHIKEFDEKYGNQIEELKIKVKELLVANTDDVIGKVKLIDILCRFDLSYHFQSEIDMQLKHIFESHINLLRNNDYDLYTTGLLFRILRQHGYKMSSGYFNKFKNTMGNFKQSLKKDARGMLSLYEATFLEVHGEDILVEAQAFTKYHLKFLSEKSNSNLAKQISNALDLPLRKSMLRFEARKFICFYEEEEFKDESLLLFAKLDFNRVQLFHQKEINNLLTWGKDLNLQSKLPHVRDRIIEAYLWSAIIYSEPRYSRARVILTKFTIFITVIDDTCDSYSTYQEMVLLLDAMQRWDMKAVRGLSNNMQIVYQTLLEEFDKIISDLTQEERSHRALYMKIAIQKVCEAYRLEGEWLHKNYVPPIPEYMEMGLNTAGCYAHLMGAFVGVDEEIADVNVFEWILSLPKISRAVYEIGRLKNDIGSHLRGEDRNHQLCAVECFLKEGLSMEEIMDKYNNTIAVNAWRDINEEFMNPSSPVSKEILVLLVNDGRLMEVIYKDGDGFTFQEKLKDIVSMLFIHKIPI